MESPGPLCFLPPHGENIYGLPSGKLCQSDTFPIVLEIPKIEIRYYQKPIPGKLNLTRFDPNALLEMCARKSREQRVKKKIAEMVKHWNPDVHQFAMITTPEFINFQNHRATVFCYHTPKLMGTPEYTRYEIVQLRNEDNVVIRHPYFSGGVHGKRYVRGGTPYVTFKISRSGGSIFDTHDGWEFQDDEEFDDFVNHKKSFLEDCCDITYASSEELNRRFVNQHEARKDNFEIASRRYGLLSCEMDIMDCIGKANYLIVDLPTFTTTNVFVYNEEYGNLLRERYGANVHFRRCGFFGDMIATISDYFRGSDVKKKGEVAYRDKDVQLAVNVGDDELLITKTSVAEKEIPEFVLFGYKVCDLAQGVECVVKFGIPEGARLAGARDSKLRCDKCTVLAIGRIVKVQNFVNRASYDVWYDFSIDKCQSKHNSNFVYCLYADVEEPSFDRDINKVCAKGLHFFSSQHKALRFHSQFNQYGLILNEDDMINALGPTLVKRSHRRSYGISNQIPPTIPPRHYYPVGVDMTLQAPEPAIELVSCLNAPMNSRDDMFDLFATNYSFLTPRKKWRSLCEDNPSDEDSCQKFPHSQDLKMMVPYYPRTSDREGAVSGTISSRVTLGDGPPEDPFEPDLFPNIPLMPLVHLSTFTLSQCENHPNRRIESLDLAELQPIDASRITAIISGQKAPEK